MGNFVGNIIQLKGILLVPDHLLNKEEGPLPTAHCTVIRS
jgi:hypothetical protein